MMNQNLFPTSSQQTRGPAFRLILAVLLGVTFALTPVASAQTYSVLYPLRSGPGGIVPFAGLQIDAGGNLYGTTDGDGTLFAGTVFKLSPDGQHSVLYNFSGRDGDGQAPFLGTLARDSSGNLYGTTNWGGIFSQLCIPGCGIVYKVDPSGKETILHTFTGTAADGSQPYAGVILDAAGNLYGVTPYGGTSGQGTVFKLDPSGHFSILYSFTGGADGANPLGTLVRDSEGNFFGTAAVGGAYGYGTVYGVSASGKFRLLHSFTGSTDGGFPESPLVMDTAGNLYGTSNLGGASGFGNVFKVDSKGNETALYSFSGGTDGSGPTYGGLVFDSSGNLYGVTPGGGNASSFGVVFKLDPSGKETVLHTFIGKDGRVPNGTPAFDAHGNLYGTTTLGGAYNGGVIYKIAP